MIVSSGRRGQRHVNSEGAKEKINTLQLIKRKKGGGREQHSRDKDKDKDALISLYLGMKCLHAHNLLTLKKPALRLHSCFYLDVLLSLISSALAARSLTTNPSVVE